MIKIKFTVKRLFFGIFAFSIISCVSDNASTIDETEMEQEEPSEEILLTASDFELTIADDIEKGSSIGRIVATTNTGILSYRISSQTFANSISIDNITGELKLSDNLEINADTQSQINAMVTISNGIKEVNSSVLIRITPALKNPQTVIYIEVNSFNMLNAGAYILENGKPFFDYAMVFGANINYDPISDRPVLGLNVNTLNVLENSELTIKPLQDKGIKVLLSILGNRQRYGFANLPDRETAANFAQQVAARIEEFNLDGVDLDDEFVNYGEDEVPSPNEFSFILLLEELRKVMPNKLITFYNIGESSRFTTFNGVEAGSILDYAWQPFYGVYNTSGLPDGLTKEKYSASAINLSTNPVSLALSHASRTKEDDFGAYMMYNLTTRDFTQYLNAISKELYDQTTFRRERIRDQDDF
ncbi:MAG: glycosyl hydrolase family 18 protein [Maribacter sp.]